MDNELARSVTLHRVAVHAKRRSGVAKGLQPSPCLATVEEDIYAAQTQEGLDASPRRFKPIVLHPHHHHVGHGPYVVDLLEAVIPAVNYVVSAVATAGVIGFSTMTPLQR